MQNVSFSSGTVTLAWSAIPGMTYRVQYKHNLDAAGWQQLGEPVTATDLVATASDPGFSGQPQRFYRILAVQ
jgi:hypothetical protein